MTGRASWVLAPTDGKTHPLAVQSPGDVVVTQRGQPLPSGMLPHDRLPSRQPCRECFAADLPPADPVFARQPPAGRWSSPISEAPDSLPSGQPVPPQCLSAAHGGHPPPRGLPRWARCPVDQRLHLLSAGEVSAAAGQRHGRAACDQLIPAAGLTIQSPPEGFCVGCLDMGTAS